MSTPDDPMATAITVNELLTLSTAHVQVRIGHVRSLLADDGEPDVLIQKFIAAEHTLSLVLQFQRRHQPPRVGIRVALDDVEENEHDARMSYEVRWGNTLVANATGQRATTAVSTINRENGAFLDMSEVRQRVADADDTMTLAIAVTVQIPLGLRTHAPHMSQHLLAHLCTLRQTPNIMWMVKGTPIPAVDFMCRRSSVLARLLSETWQQKSDAEDDTAASPRKVVLQHYDFAACVFERLMQYLHTGNYGPYTSKHCESGGSGHDTPLDLYKTAHFFAVPDLQELLHEELMDFLTVNTIMTYFASAHQFEDDELMKSIAMFAERNRREYVRTPQAIDFQTFSPDVHGALAVAMEKHASNVRMNTINPRQSRRKRARH